MRLKSSFSYGFFFTLACNLTVNKGLCQRIISQENTPVITDFSFTKIAALPKQINEASGLENCGDSIYWTHNDGGLSVIYGLNDKGEIVKTVHLKNKNRGWEDLTFDSSNNLYIAATGNNKGDKGDLKIYKIPNPNTISDPIILAQTISFTYSDNPSKKSYDSDALVAIGDSLYIFTKNRTVPNDGMVHMYALPNEPGKYIAQEIDSFKLEGAQFDNWITGADISEDGELLALLFHRKILFVEKIKGRLFSEGKFTWLNLDHFSHKAGIVIMNKNTIYIVDELEMDILGGNFYHLNLQYFKE
ncbi:MAG: hypothetical protein ACI9L9_000031 [Marivirga sp.]|jgi:hypothetical protein